MLQYIVIIGAVAQFIGAFFYIRETIRGNTKPNKITWLVWTIAPLIGTIAALSDGVGWAVLPVFMAGFIPLLVFIASFVNKKAYWKLQPFDYICGILAILALVLWGITKEPVVAIIFSLTSNFFASIPTIIKSWKYPETESVSSYMAGLFSALTGFFALKTFGVEEIAFPMCLVLVNTTLVVGLLRGRWKN